VHKNTSGTEFRRMFQKHHAGPDNSDAHDSKVTHSGGMGSQHQKEEHKDPNLHTLHETTSGGGTWSFNMVGNNALGDLAQESKNWPKQGQMSETAKPDWGSSLPKNEAEMAEASKVDWAASPHPKRSIDEMLVEKHKAWPPQHIDQVHRTGPFRNPPLRQPPSDGEEIVEKRKLSDPTKPSRELAQKMKVASLIGVDVPHPDEELVEKRAFNPPPGELIPFPNNPSKGHLYHAGKAFDMPALKEEDDNPSPAIEKRALDSKDPGEKVPECCKYKHSSSSTSMHPPADENLVEKRWTVEPNNPNKLYNEWNDKSKGHLWHSGAPVDMPAKGPGEVPECCKHKHSGSSTSIQPPSSESLVEKRNAEPVDPDSPVEKAKHIAGKRRSEAEIAYYDMPEMDRQGHKTTEEMQAHWREHPPTKVSKPYTATNRVECGQTFTPEQQAANARVADVSNKHPKKHLVIPATPLNPAKPPTEKRSVDEMLVHKHEFKQGSEMPPSEKRSEVEHEAALQMALRADNGDIQARDSSEVDLLVLPGHPYLVGHAAANAVQVAGSHPTTLDDIHINAAAYDQTSPELEARSEWTNLHPTHGDRDEAKRTYEEYQESRLLAGVTKSIIVLPDRESQSHRNDSHKLNTIQICVVVLMSLCLFGGLAFLSYWVSRKVRARNSRRRATVAEDRQRDLEMEELVGEDGVEREVVVARGAERGEPK
jgi:hypothetical protein